MEFEKGWNINWKEWKDLNSKMRKMFKNAKARHGLNSKSWIRLIGLSFLRDQKRRRREEKGRRRRKGRGREEEEKRRKKEQKGMEL